MSLRVNKLALAAMVAALSTGLVACKKQESSAELVAQAKQFQQKGDVNAAVIQLKNALQANPEDGEARYMLAAAYMENGDPATAEKEVRRAIAAKYSPEHTMPVLVRALVGQGQFQKALDETAEEAKKSHPELLAARAYAYFGLAQQDKATAELDAALVAKPGHVPALIGKARVIAVNRDMEGASKFISDALAAEPKNVEALMFKADLLRAQNKSTEALAVYDQVLAAKPKHRSAYVEKAYLEISDGKYDKAQADLTAARQITPGGLLVNYTQALLDFAQGKNSAAEEGVQKVLRVAPEHMPTLLLAGAIAVRQGSMQQAENHLRKYLEAYPNNAYARKMLATALLRGGQGADALNVLEPSLKNTDDVQLLALAGESYMQARDFGKATEFFEKASILAPKSASLHTSLGVSKLQTGDKEKGMAELELATKLDANSVHAGLTLVRAELAQKNYDKALAAVNTLLQTQPNNAVVHDLKGLVLVGRKDMAGARASFDKAASLQPNYYPATANLATLAMLEKKPADAKAHLNAFLEKNKKSAEAMTALAALAANERNIPEATRWLEQAQAENPDAIGPAIRLANQYLVTKQEQKALTLVRKMQVTNPDSLELLDLLGKAQMANQDLSGALESYSKFAAAQPKNAPVQMALANLHMMLKNPTAAEASVKKALQLQPDYPAAQLAYAELLFRKKQPDQAIAQARALQKAHPTVAAGFMLEGDILMNQGKAAQALSLYEKGLALSKSPDMLMKTANALRATGKGAEAEKRLTQAIQQHPTDYRLQLFRAEYSLGDKQYKQAAEQLEAIVKAQPNHAAALNNLAYAYQQNKDSRALATADAAYKLASEEPAVMDTLGWILVEQGDTKRALPLLQKASVKAPQSADIRYHLAVGLFKSGDKVGARKEAEQALANGQAFAQADDARALLKQLQ